MDPLEGAERVRKALAEAGYPDAHVNIFNGNDILMGDFTSSFRKLPKQIMWKAVIVAGLNTSCWACWDVGMAKECDNRVFGLEDCGKDR